MIDFSLVLSIDDWVWCNLKALEIQWLPKGTKFLIVDESDLGIETLYTKEDLLTA